jgi:hypothetical protein
MSGHRTRSVFDRYNVVEDEDVRAAVRTIEAGAHRDMEEEARSSGRVLDTVDGECVTKHEGPTDMSP